MPRQAQHERDGWRLLQPHPDGRTPQVEVAARVHSLPNSRCVVFAYEVRGAIDSIVLPRRGRAPTRADNLWQTTCFEAFCRTGDEAGYREFNFSPSGDWAVYDFTSYRTRGPDPRVGQEMVVAFMPHDDIVVLEGIVAARDVASMTTWRPTAVIEEVDGTKSYWALAHPPGAPDFHHPDCFALHIPALA